MTHRYTDRHEVTLPRWDFEGSRGVDEHGRRVAALFEAEILRPAQIAGQADSLVMRLPIYRLVITVLRDAPEPSSPLESAANMPQPLPPRQPREAGPQHADRIDVGEPTRYVVV